MKKYFIMIKYGYDRVMFPFESDKNLKDVLAEARKIGAETFTAKEDDHMEITITQESL